MTSNALTYVKLGIVGLVVLGGFVLVGMGKLDASAMYSNTTTAVGALVVALGISSAGAAVAAKMLGGKPAEPPKS